MSHPARMYGSVLLLATFLAGCTKDEPPVEVPPEGEEPEPPITYPDPEDPAVTVVQEPPAEPGIPRTATTIGSAIALSITNGWSVVANRTGEVRVMTLDLQSIPAVAQSNAAFDFGDAEPWAAVLSTLETEAYVVLRESQQVQKLSNLGPAGQPTLDITAPTGSEPTSIAITPLGTKIYVANWGEGTVTAIDTATMAVTGTIDLNAALVATGVLGSSVTVPRLGLARPYAIAVTNDGDGDDTDETVYVTEFFGQDDPSAVFTGDSFFDTNKQGFVYHFNVGTEQVGVPISLGASADMGFLDSNGDVAGCSPNQLYSVALDNGRLYVAGLCASPRGPAAPGAVDKVSNFKTKVQSVLYVVDTATNTERADERVHLNRAWEDEYVADGVPDDASRRYPLIVQSMAFLPQTPDLHVLYLAAYGADALFRLEFDGNGQVLQVGSNQNKFINLAASPNVGKLPVGVGVSPFGDAVVVNDDTRNLSLVDLGFQTVESVAATATPLDPNDSFAVAVANGKRFFATGTTRWSLNGQAWNSCEGCHPGGLTDNVTWFFATGPRQSVALDGSYGPNGEHRVFNWTGIFDEIADFEGNTRGISGGVGAIVHDNTDSVVNDDRIVFDTLDPALITGNQQQTLDLQAGLNGSTFELIEEGLPARNVAGDSLIAQSVLDDFRDIEVWAETIRAPRAPAGLDPAAVSAGAALFTQNGCNGCHGGPTWTISERFYTPSQQTNDAETGTLSVDTYSRGSLPIGLNPPSDAGGGTAVFRAGGSIQCVLRDIGTFGVGAPGVVVSERKDDMVSEATGATGFNPPALLSASVGAPYLHAGNARTLEEVFTSFPDHCRAFSANCSLTGASLTNMVAFLQSIDDEASTFGTTVGSIDPVICD
jgi:YVTN family beta-propeller protein